MLIHIYMYVHSSESRSCKGVSAAVLCFITGLLHVYDAAILVYLLWKQIRTNKRNFNVLIASAYMSPTNACAGVSSHARSLNFGMRLYLHPHLSICSIGSDESAHICPDLSEPLLLADAIRTEIYCTGLSLS